jgi:chorismate mutase
MNYLSIVFISLLALSVNAQELTFSATRRLVEPVLNNEIKPENIVEVTYQIRKSLRKLTYGK